jgi:hypothetical protein
MPVPCGGVEGYPAARSELRVATLLLPLATHESRLDAAPCAILGPFRNRLLRGNPGSAWHPAPCPGGAPEGKKGLVRYPHKPLICIANLAAAPAGSTSSKSALYPAELRAQVGRKVPLEPSRARVSGTSRRAGAGPGRTGARWAAPGGTWDPACGRNAKAVEGFRGVPGRSGCLAPPACRLRTSDPKDERVTVLEITAKGRQTLEDIRVEKIAAILSGFSAEEKRDLLDKARRIIGNRRK